MFSACCCLNRAGKGVLAAVMRGELKFKQPSGPIFVKGLLHLTLSIRHEGLEGVPRRFVPFGQNLRLISSVGVTL